MAFDRKTYMKSYHRQWYLNNRSRLLKKYSEYAIQHKKDIDLYKKDWYKQNAEELRERSRKNSREKKYSVKLAYNLRKLYGLSVDEFKTLLMRQNGLCAICKQGTKIRLSVDHCHTTGVVRGLLCHKCNFAIGLFNDDPSLLTAAIKYLTEDMKYVGK